MSDDELKSLFQEMRQDIGAVREATTTLQQDIGAVREETATLRQDIGAVREETATLRQDIEAARKENTAAHAETRRHFDVVAEGSKHETKLVAEGVAMTRESLDREAADIRSEVRRTASETQAMIKFSHAELDRRMRTLEDAVSDLQARVERLETSTH